MFYRLRLSYDELHRIKRHAERATQYIELDDGGCDVPFEPQLAVVRSLREALGQLLGGPVDIVRAI